MTRRASCIYRGMVRHRRFAPKRHTFRMPLFMMYLDLEELDALFARRLFWSTKRPALARFKRSDYFGDPSTNLDTAVRDHVQSETGSRPDGPIRVLTHLRYFGYTFNPVTFYYCFAPDGHTLRAIVAEITNTPWKERHAYVLPVNSADRRGSAFNWQFSKQFHISPFMDMEQRYDWTFAPPEDRLVIHMRTFEDADGMFDATLKLRRVEITGASLAATLLRFPLMTTQVIARIHFEALRLWLKRVPIFPHPKKRNLSEASSS